MSEREKILVIDDDEMLLLTTKGLLEAEGYEVVTQIGAFGAASVVNRERPALVLLDVNMPGLSGVGLVDLLTSEGAAARPKILFHSSNDADRLRLAVRETGVDGYVCKGDPLELRDRVGAALRD